MPRVRAASLAPAPGRTAAELVPFLCRSRQRSATNDGPPDPAARRSDRQCLL